MSGFERLAQHVDRAAPPLTDVARARQRSRLVEALADRPRRRPWQILLPALGVAVLTAALYFKWHHPGLGEPDSAAEAWWMRVPQDTIQVLPERGELELIKETSAHLEQSGRAVRIVLDRGEVHSHVIPHRGTVWAVQVGAYLVEAVGTRFSVRFEPSDQQLNVAVQEGTVHVSGGQLGSSKVALEPGQSLTVRGTQVGIDRDVAASSKQAATDDSPQKAAQPASVEGATSGSPALVGPEPANSGVRGSAPSSSASKNREATWLELERTGQHRAALTKALELGFDGLVSSLGCADLVLLSDAARLSRDTAHAAQALTAVRGRCGSSPASGRALFLLGRLEEDRNTSAAVERYREYLASGAQEFAEQALGRMLAAEQRLGRTEQAKSAAARYLELYPGGSYESMARSLASP
jgi:hypothetical protein